MRRTRYIIATSVLLIGMLTRWAFARPQHAGAAASASTASVESVPIDGIAVRLESDIITDSQVRELAAYQKLVDGKPRPRSDVIRELIDQWIVRGEANAAQYPQPSAADVNAAFASIEKRFGSSEEFKKDCASAGISEADVRRILTEQLYLSRFLDFRFRPAAQVSSAQVQKYYDDNLVPELKAKSEKVPPLSDVQTEIQEVLIQQAIDALSKQWLDDTRSGLTIDILQQGEGQ